MRMRRHFNVGWGAIQSVAFHILRLQAQFVNHLTIEILPVYYPSPAEQADARLYAENVRRYVLGRLRHLHCGKAVSLVPLLVIQHACEKGMSGHLLCCKKACSASAPDKQQPYLLHRPQSHTCRSAPDAYDCPGCISFECLTRTVLGFLMAACLLLRAGTWQGSWELS